MHPAGIHPYSLECFIKPPQKFLYLYSLSTGSRPKIIYTNRKRRKMVQRFSSNRVIEVEPRVTRDPNRHRPHRNNLPPSIWLGCRRKDVVVLWPYNLHLGLSCVHPVYCWTMCVTGPRTHEDWLRRVGAIVGVVDSVGPGSSTETSRRVYFDWCLSFFSSLFLLVTWKGQVISIGKSGFYCKYIKIKSFI